MVKKLVIGADIGGTNARIQTLNANGEFVDSRTYPRANYAGPAEVFRAYEQDMGGKIEQISLAVAGLVVPGTDTIDMSNGWTFSLGDLRKEFIKVHAMNDYTPVSYAVMNAAEHPENADVIQIGGGQAEYHGPTGVVGIGTGMGSAQIPYINGQYETIEGEIGFTTVKNFSEALKEPMNTDKKRLLLKLAPSLREEMMLRVIAEKYEHISHGHVSIERICCGPGMVELHDALCVLDGRHDLYGTRQPADITNAALGENACPVAREALDRTMGYLGRPASNMAVQMKATAGIYIASHIINKIIDAAPGYLESSPLRRNFDAHGRGEPFLTKIPLFILRDKEPAFTGLKLDLQRQ